MRSNQRASSRRSHLKGAAVWLAGPLLCGAMTLVAGGGWCAEAADSSAAMRWSQPSLGPFLKMVFFLAVVIVLIWVTLKLLRRAMGLKGAGIAGVQLVGGVPLGPRKSLQFIKVGEALYLLGATEHHIGLIAVIDRPEDVSRILKGQRSSRSPVNQSLLTAVGREPFTRMLQRLMGRGEVGTGLVLDESKGSSGD